MRVLFVCRDNVCTSPMAAALLLAETRQRNISDVVIASAGFGVPGVPVAQAAVSVAEAREINLSRKQSRTLDAPMAGPADMVLTVSSQTREWVVEAVPAAAPKTFVLGQLVASGPPREPGQRADAWVAAQRDAAAGATSFEQLVEPDPNDFGAVLDHADALIVQIQALVDRAWPLSIVGR